MNFWSKRIKGTKNLAGELNVSEDKIEALKNNNLEIGGATMDRTLEAIENNKIQGLIQDNEIWKWVLETDFKKKREEFGYTSQKEVARLVGCDASIICNLENHKDQFKRVTPKIRSIYEFYTNEFNKNTGKKKPAIKTSGVHHINMKVNKENKHIWQWYKKTNIKELRKSRGYDNLYELAKLIGVSQSCLSDLELKHFKRVNKTILNAYNFYNGTGEKPDTTSIVLHPTNITIAKYIPDANDITKNDEIGVLEARIKQLEEKNKDLELQLSRYEKLIDRM